VNETDKPNQKPFSPYKSVNKVNTKKGLGPFVS